ncbi:MAG TPA: tetratricopeptide repeat protein, partial [Myxococcaceae bacterium]|nr:tetratricopeptide repeat protein [Myxococcaceae bacterium]
PEALAEVEALKEVESLPPDLLARHALAQGRLLSVAGRHGEAVKRLSEGARGFGTRAYDFNLALGDARKASADMAGAQEALEAAVKARPRSEEARAALARVLLARDRERDALGRLNDVEGRKAALVRGAIYGRLGDWKRARAELAKTQIDGKYPAEAVVYLGLADLAEGNEERAQEALERALGSARRFKAEIRVALAQVYWKRGALEKAKVQFAEAAKEPLDYEGACGLGRMLRAQGEIEAALDPLSKAAARNPSHGEARSALVRSYLDLNRVNEALAQAQAWEKDSPESALAQRDYAFVLHHAGKEKEAEAASKRAVKLNGDDPEAYRVRAEILFALGDAKDAFAALEAANKRDPKDPETFCAIGHAFLRGGKGDNAQKAFEAALRNDEKSACGRIGLQLAKLPGGAKAAVKELPELAKGAARPWERALAWATLARAELALGNTNQARKAAEQAVQLAPLSGEAQLARGLVAVRQRDEATAKGALEKAAEREPAHAGVHLALGDLLSRSEAELDRARQAYEAYLRFGGEPAEQARVKKALTTLKKRLAAR